MNKELNVQNQTVNVRYIVNDIDSSVAFYSTKLGFEIVQHVKDAFANLSLGNLHLLINKPGAGGAGQAMTDGTVPAPGGWNRIQIVVKDIEATVEKLQKEGVKFRNDIVIGNGGKQILLVDPSGNLVEVFEPRK